jgi:hypothetical protein
VDTGNHVAHQLRSDFTDDGFDFGQFGHETGQVGEGNRHSRTLNSGSSAMAIATLFAAASAVSVIAPVLFEGSPVRTVCSLPLTRQSAKTARAAKERQRLPGNVTRMKMRFTLGVGVLKRNEMKSMPLNAFRLL